MSNYRKTALVLGAGGFIGSHMVKRLRSEGYWVRGVDLKFPEFSETESHEFIVGDLRDVHFVERVLQFKGYTGNFYNFVPSKYIEPFDEIYQFAADMGGAGFVFTGENDADIMNNSATINLNVLEAQRQLNDFKAVNKTKVFYSSSACFVEGTKVLTDDGFLPIEKITTDHKVMAEDGKWHSVTNIHKKHYCGDLVEVHSLSSSRIVCTPDHRFLLEDKTWEKAENLLNKTIFQVIPDLSGDNKLQLVEDPGDLAELWNEVDSYDDCLYKLAEKYNTSFNTPYNWYRLKLNGKFPNRSVDPVLIKDINKSYDLGWLLGIILSEGWVEKNKKHNSERLVVCFGKHETELIEKYKLTLQKIFDIHNDRIIQYNARTGIKIHVTSKKLVNLFNDILADISHGSTKKRMTLEGMTGPKEYLQGILDGANDGDGSIQIREDRNNYTRHIWNTTSKELSLQYSMLLNSFGLFNSTNVRPAGEWNIEGRTGKSSESYFVYIKKNNTKINKISRISNEGGCYVYNLDVEDVHSYIVEGCVVHNCMYPEHNQLDPDNPDCREDSAYPANPDSEYGWEKLFSERIYFAYNRNYQIPVRVARYHNIFGIEGTIEGGREKAPAAICRKVAYLPDTGGAIEVWGDGKQTRSFLYIDECIEATRRLMDSDFIGPINIGSEEMVTINQLVDTVAKVSGKVVKKIHKLDAPLGVRGRNSNNDLIRSVLGWDYAMTLEEGITKTYAWINEQVQKEKEQ